MAADTSSADVTARSLFAEAVARHLAGDASAAIDLYQQAIARDAGFAEACNNLAALLARSGDEAGAERLLQRAVSLQPDYGEAHNNLGILWSTSGDYARAVPAFERAVALDGARAGWLSNLGNAYVEGFRFAEALAAYDRALALRPVDAECWSNRGLALRGLQRPEEAITSLQRALALAPAHVGALSNLGVILKEQKRLDEAEAMLQRATDIDPANAQLWCNYASIAEASGDYERVRARASHATILDPAYPESYNLLANCEMERGEYDAALAFYDQALALDPENRNANWNVALIWLLHGDYPRGWRQFEWRKRLQSVVLDRGDHAGNEWAGESVEGRAILLHTEQGIGDAIQFVRLASELKTRGARRVYLECPYPIVPLLSGVAGLDAVIARGTPLPAFDVHASLMSLPWLLGITLETVPSAVPYIPVEPRPARGAVTISAGQLAVGFAWAGNPGHARDFLRSIPLPSFRPLFDVDGAQFFSLQKGARADTLHEHAPADVVDLAPVLDDFRDTAAVIDALDLVITVDTSVAHLAGALGKATWLLVTHVPDFRWLLDRDDSPWYPTVRLFRQPSPGDWESVVSDVRHALIERVARHRSVAETRVAPPRAAGVDDTIVTLNSATRVPDGRPRFDLWLPLSALADGAAFAEYEAELIGGGHDLPIRAFLDEVLASGDVFVDVAPRLGLTAMSAVSGPERPAALVLVDADASNAGRIAQLVTRRASTLAVDCVTSLREAFRCRPPADGGQRLVRVGDAAMCEQVADAVGSVEAATRPAVIVWSAIAPAEQASSFAFFEALGYVTVTLSLVAGEPSLDTVLDASRPQILVTLAPSALDALEARARQGSTAPESRAAADQALPDTRAPHVQVVGIDWQLRTDTGWGVYGTNLALELERTGTTGAALFAADTTDLPPIVRYRLQRPLAAAAERMAALQRGGGALNFDGVMLRALGNNCGHGPLWQQVSARRNVGVIFFEDTTFDAEALHRARSLDLVVTGSHWNAEVLRALGLERVVTVLQGVDPTVFHPAPRSGHLDGRFVVFSGGKLEFRKGQDLVVAAFRAFRQRHPEALLLTAWHNSWPALITDLDLAGHVRGIPCVNEGRLDVTAWLAHNGIPADALLDVGRTANAMMGQVVREADVALFPNRCEGGTNLVAMECMAAGVPTIVSHNTGHRDLVHTGGCVPLTRQGRVPTPTRFFRGVDGWGESDVEEMVAALEAVYAARTNAQLIAERGAAAMAALTWRTQTAQLLQHLATLS